MYYTIEKDNVMTLHADAWDLVTLEKDIKQDFDVFDSDEYLENLMEEFLSDSDLDWINPKEVGALTDAPMLGLRDERGLVTHAWAWMDYQTTSLQGELLENECAILVGGRCLPKESPILEYFGADTYRSYLVHARNSSLMGTNLNHLSREDLLVIIGYLDKTITKVTGILEEV